MVDEYSAHKIAHNLIRQLAADQRLAEKCVELYGEAPRCFLDDDFEAGDEPRILATPDSTSGGCGQDDEMDIRLVISARDRDTDAGQPQPDADGLAQSIPAGAALDAFASETWRAVQDATPGAILLGRSIDWDFASFAPLRFAIFTLNYRQIHSYGD